jgi:hypothetical protein
MEALVPSGGTSRFRLFNDAEEYTCSSDDSPTVLYTCQEPAS